jgi:hypothetical protein
MGLQGLAHRQSRQDPIGELIVGRGAFEEVSDVHVGVLALVNEAAASEHTAVRGSGWPYLTAESGIMVSRMSWEWD